MKVPFLLHCQVSFFGSKLLANMSYQTNATKDVKRTQTANHESPLSYYLENIGGRFELRNKII